MIIDTKALFFFWFGILNHVIILGKITLKTRFLVFVLMWYLLKKFIEFSLCHILLAFGSMKRLVNETNHLSFHFRTYFSTWIPNVLMEEWIMFIFLNWTKIPFDSNIENQTSLTKPIHNISNALNLHLYSLIKKT